MPQQTRRAQFRSLHEKIHANGKEEGQAASELINIHAARHGGFDVFFTVRKGIGQFLNQVRTRLLHMVARDRD